VCKRDLDTQVVWPLCTEEGGTNIKMGRDVYRLNKIQTPRKGARGRYPNYTICTYSLIPLKFNHLFCYVFDVIPPIDFEKSRQAGQCYDSIEFDHFDTRTGSNVNLIQCGTSIDKRLDNGASLLSNVELSFKSDQQTRRQGANFRVAEFPVNVSLCIRS